MKTIHLFQFKNSFSRNIPFFKEECRLDNLNDLMTYDLMNTEKVTEFIIDIHDDFIFEDTSRQDLLKMCKNAKETIEHYFVTDLNDYDVI
ncbi:heme oxygenase [Chryseobacterium sp. MEBOG06]|uniref:heme oxygenase n=1 Tax=unclassified Chryseobacterium TaxID=2593645 RepID=UPI001F3F0623|nr:MULTISPECIES: heme oxygenase [unclassified Chryseobacterium]UKB82069.1 heme oxygenase [Chryseobacterium sp. MEBOG06]